MNRKLNEVIKYYENFESRWGYTFFTWDTKHFGYYPSEKRNIGEKDAQKLMMDFLATKLNLNEGEFVLDAGCGRGTTSCYLAEKYKVEIIGIDLVSFELEIAKKKAKEIGLGNKVTFYGKDYSKTGFPKNHFDKIFTLETLVHSPDIKKTLTEFKRILKPNGTLVLFEYSKSLDTEFSPWEKKMMNIIIKGSAMMSLPKMIHNKLPNIIKESGFKVISDEDITENMLPSAERFYKWALFPYFFIKLFKLQKKIINTTAGVEFYKMLKKGLGKYRVIVARNLQ